jgi:hypothetical protein
MTKSAVEEKLDEISDALEKLKDKPKDRYDLIKDLALPFGTLLIAALSIILTHISSEKQREDASYVRQQRYIEFFLNNFSDPSKQAVAFELLAEVDQKNATSIVNTVLLNEKKPSNDELIEMAKNLPDGFGIEIFYAKSDLKAETLAHTIEEGIKRLSIEIKDIKAVDAEFWKNYGTPDGNEIRYDAQNGEYAATKFLYMFLRVNNPNARFTVIPVKDNSRPLLMSLFLP